VCMCVYIQINLSIYLSTVTDADDDGDDDVVLGDCLLVDSGQLSVTSYWLGSYDDPAIIDVSWSLDTSRLVTLNAAVGAISFLILVFNSIQYCVLWRSVTD